jgi:TolA-binding protein
MSRVPESFYFYKAQLQRAKEEKERLKKDYEAKIDNLNNEISFLKEQIQAQHTMIEQSVDYVMKLEQQINSFNLELSNE